MHQHLVIEKSSVTHRCIDGYLGYHLMTYCGSLFSSSLHWDLWSLHHSIWGASDHPEDWAQGRWHVINNSDLRVVLKPHLHLWWGLAFSFQWQSIGDSSMDINRSSQCYFLGLLCMPISICQLHVIWIKRLWIWKQLSTKRNGWGSECEGMMMWTCTQRTQYYTNGAQWLLLFTCTQRTVQGEYW